MKALRERPRDFHDILLVRGYLKSQIGPQALANQSYRIGKGGQGFGIPCRRANGQALLGQEGMSKHGNERKQAQESGCGTRNGLIRPLALGFDAEMLTDMAQGGFHLPTALEEDQDVERVKAWVSGQERLRVKLARHIADESEANRHRGLSGMIPHGLMGAYLNVAQLVVIPDDGPTHPAGAWVIDKLLGRWQTLACPMPA